jgi:hypothetical protein
MKHWKFWNDLAADARLHFLVAWLSQSTSVPEEQAVPTAKVDEPGEVTAEGSLESAANSATLVAAPTNHILYGLPQKVMVADGIKLQNMVGLLWGSVLPNLASQMVDYFAATKSPEEDKIKDKVLALYFGNPLLTNPFTVETTRRPPLLEGEAPHKLNLPDLSADSGSYANKVRRVIVAVMEFWWNSEEPQLSAVNQLTSHLFLSYDSVYKSEISGKIGPDPKGVPKSASSFQTTNKVSIALLPWPHALASCKQLEFGLPLQLEQFLCKRMVYRFVHHLAVNILKASASESHLVAGLQCY